MLRIFKLAAVKKNKAQMENDRLAPAPKGGIYYSLRVWNIADNGFPETLEDEAAKDEAKDEAKDA